MSGPALRLVFATRNPGKLVELRALLGAGLVEPCEVLTLDQAGCFAEVVEDGDSFEANARKKAVAAAAETGLLALADDSGLEVEALGGAPGVHSARYAGVQGDDAQNRAKLLAALDGVPPPRRARFRCVLVLARPSAQGATGPASPEILAVEEGSCAGEIALVPRGTGGFGYDPLFLVPSLGRTMAELLPEEKNRISHRAEAMTRMVRRIVELGRVLLQGAEQ